MQIEQLIQKAAEGDKNAQYTLGEAYEYGESEDGEAIAKDKKCAVEWYRKSAEQGHATAQASLAAMYQYGRGVRKNLKQAAAWYKKSAEQGYALAQASLADLYRDGEGVSEDLDTALSWYKKAADQGAPTYQRKYAEALIDDDAQEAVRWYHLAAEAGDAEAQFKLAKLHEEGSGVPQNQEEAFHWYLKAEQLQEECYLGLGADARFEIGSRYAVGQGVEKNSEEALRRLLPIADPRITNDPWLMSRAQIWVVTVFADPEHTKHDIVEAYAWLNLAATYAPTGQEFYGIMSRESAVESRETLGARLTKEQLKQAELRSKELFVPRKKIDARLGRS